MIDNPFKSIASRAQNEKAARMKEAEKIIPWGISYLNVALQGILANDLVVIGAPTGAGKTELVTHIALNAAQSGRKVKVFALEADEFEIERRIKYKRLAYYHSIDPQRDNSQRPNYLSWYLGKQDALLGKYEEIVSVELAQITNLEVFYREGAFGLENFKQIATTYAQDAELIIIDHLHYFDLRDGDENRGLSDIVMKLKDYTKALMTPIVLVSHMRKSDRAYKVAVPSVDDFHGSSNIVKQANVVISMASGKPKTGSTFETYVRVCKARKDSAAQKFIGVCTYDGATNSYTEDFEIGQLSSDEKKVEILTDDHLVPEWAKRLKTF